VRSTSDSQSCVTAAQEPCSVARLAACTATSNHLPTGQKGGIISVRPTVLRCDSGTLSTHPGLPKAGINNLYRTNGLLSTPTEPRPCRTCSGRDATWARPYAPVAAADPPESQRKVAAGARIRPNTAPGHLLGDLDRGSSGTVREFLIPLAGEEGIGVFASLDREFPRRVRGGSKSTRADV